MLSQLRPAIVMTGAVHGAHRPRIPSGHHRSRATAAPAQANGSLIERHGKIIGSELIGQNFVSGRYFHGRPSATSAPIRRMRRRRSTRPTMRRTRRAPISGRLRKKLVDRVNAAIEAELAAGRFGEVAADAVTTSASGLDPHISPQYALAQAASVAKMRGLPEQRVRLLVEGQIEGASPRVIGEPRVNVLRLNLALTTISNSRYVEDFVSVARRPPPRSRRAPVPCGKRRKGAAARLPRRGAGVGKTWAMLARAAPPGPTWVDVVVGLVETHGRKETQELAEGLEILARRRIDHRGRVVEEFDIDAALARKPRLIIVDETGAHERPRGAATRSAGRMWTNCSGGRRCSGRRSISSNSKSLADVVSRFTGVVVRETVPDRVLQKRTMSFWSTSRRANCCNDSPRARSMSPKRRAGDAEFLHSPQSHRLRELALRRTAEARVDDQMVDYLRQGAIEGPWATAERLLVCIGGDSASEAVVRAAARLAAAINATWIALHVAPRASGRRAREVLRSVDSACASPNGSERKRRTLREMTLPERFSVSHGGKTLRRSCWADPAQAR